MDQLDLLLNGFDVALSWYNISFLIIGVFAGILIGVLPGLGAANGIAILLPLTIGLEPLPALMMLTSVYWGAMLGGSITAILFNIPGDPASLPTTFDGHPMAKQGRAVEAMTLAFAASAFGALVGTLLVTFSASAIAKFGLKFGAPEYFSVYIFAFACFVGMGSTDPLKSFVSIVAGLAIATIGMDTVSGQTRMTFGSLDLIRGVSFMLVVIGMIGLSEIFQSMEKGIDLEGVSARMRIKVVIETIASMPRYWLSLIRGAAVGCWMGVLPGSGATVASLMSYGLARRFSKRSSHFGTGEPEGVVSPETSDHAAATSSMLPMLTLGIPGSGATAVLLGGLLMWGIRPGPTMFTTQPDLAWGLIASMYLGNMTCVLVILVSAPLFASILRVPFYFIGPVIVIVCMIGAYAINRSIFDVYIILIFAIVGYFFKKLEYPIAPLILALVLGNQTEDALRQSILISRGSLEIFFHSAISSTFLLAAAALIILPTFSKLVRKNKNRDSY